MNKCPKCQQLESLCEQVDVEKGEVVGYICNACGYQEWEEEYIHISHKVE